MIIGGPPCRILDIDSEPESALHPTGRRRKMTQTSSKAVPDVELGSPKWMVKCWCSNMNTFCQTLKQHDFRFKPVLLKKGDCLV